MLLLRLIYSNSHSHYSTRSSYMHDTCPSQDSVFQVYHLLLRDKSFQSRTPNSLTSTSTPWSRLRSPSAISHTDGTVDSLSAVPVVPLTSPIEVDGSAVLVATCIVGFASSEVTEKEVGSSLVNEDF